MEVAAASCGGRGGHASYHDGLHTPVEVLVASCGGRNDLYALVALIHESLLKGTLIPSY